MPANLSLVYKPTLTLWYTDKFQPPKYLYHYLAVQMMQIRAEAAGWHSWQRSTHQLNHQGDVLPDATVVDPQGALCWIEIERTVKGSYAETIISRVRVRELRGWYRCIYISPRPEIAVRVRRGIDAVAKQHFNQNFELLSPGSKDQERSRISEQTLQGLFPTRTFENAFKTPYRDAIKLVGIPNAAQRTPVISALP